MRKRKRLCGRILVTLALLTGIAGPLLAVDITLTWTPSATNTDGSPVGGSNGYRIYYGFSSSAYTQSIDIGSASSATIPNIDETKTYFFAATCYNASGKESSFSRELIWISSSTSDPDSDGMPDAWEIEHFGTPEASDGDALRDSDGDGVPNLAEYIAGTSPTNDGSVPYISITFTNGLASVVFDAPEAAGSFYEGRARYMTLEQCDDLNTGLWFPVAGHEMVPARNQTLSYTDPAANPQRFYRFRIRLE